VKNPELGATMRLLGSHGADAFYRGEVAAKIVAHHREIGAPQSKIHIK
jgi:gamma-glutamyltranspeptidase